MTDTTLTDGAVTFADLGLSGPLTEAVNALGYEAPTPIQRETIPLLLGGQDLIGQAQTGTGKTAAFVLPILERLDVERREVQALVLTPTRELAIQVAEAVHSYARGMPGTRAMPIYGGDSIQKQTSRLRGGMHVIVGTPGRVMDHLRRGTLNLGALRFVVLDEADEMLRMGFLDDVEWILQQAPAERQTALFSATMPPQVRRIAESYLKNPVTAEIKRTTLTVPTIEQQYLHVSQSQKLDALTKLLELEAVPGEAILIFARTKLGCAGLADKLQARGYAAEAMHGDMNQAQRESVVRRMRSGQVEIVVATDVAARGLDVDRLSLVVNYDMPSDTDSYVHRIGRTGRAGSEGKAILFVTPRESRMLRDIERYTKQKLTPVRTPTAADVAARRTAVFKERIVEALEKDGLDPYLTFVEALAEESGRDMAEIAAAAVRVARGETPPDEQRAKPETERAGFGAERARPEPPPELRGSGSGEATRIALEVGREHNVGPGDVVGAIANETGLPGRAIGSIDIHDRVTLVEIPADLVGQVLERLSGVNIRGQALSPRLTTSDDPPPRKPSNNRPGASGFKKKHQGKVKTKPGFKKQR
jgi:ATP-dependent RNA helicase DeaD